MQFFARADKVRRGRIAAPSNMKPILRDVLKGGQPLRSSAVALLLLAACGGPENVSGKLGHSAYVWQRHWGKSVKESIQAHGGEFEKLVALGTEVSFKAGAMKVAQVELDYEDLRRSNRPVGLAMRVGPYGGPFQAGDRTSRSLCDLLGRMVGKARSNQLAVAEVQIDFDCADAKLDGYRVWVGEMKRAVAPTPIVITALPSWLKRGKAFKKLVSEADGYVLQVHSLERPGGIGEPFTLCRPESALDAVRRAGKMGAPFVVALPTYSYLVAFDAAGKFLGIGAEGVNWKAGTRVQEARSQPAELAGLVREWERSRPASMRGLIWYRLPIADDTLNWRWPTLRAVMEGRMPKPGIVVTAAHPDPRLTEVFLTNEGEDDFSAPVAARATWGHGRLLACDALEGFEIAGESAGKVEFKSKGGVRSLSPGSRRKIGWLRLEEEDDVKIELEGAR